MQEVKEEVLNWKGSMKYGMPELFIHIFMLIYGVVTKSFITGMFKSNSGEPYVGKLHVRFLEEFISN